MINQNPTQQKSMKSAMKHGIFWSVIQNWGGRLISFFTAIFLARILGPEQYGIVGIVYLILAFIPMIADFGFSVAIIQKKDIEARDLNLPFYISIILGIVLAVCLISFSNQIEKIINTPGLAKYFFAIAGITLITIPSSFQESLYVRNMLFKTLAFRRVTIDFGAGIVAVFMAYNGFGVWSIVTQAFISAFLGLLWLWIKPQWVPNTFFSNYISFKSLIKVGFPVFLERLRDFLSTKLVDFLIVSLIGVLAYGMYVAASRLYATLMQLLHGAMFNAMLTTLSKISDDIPRLRLIYIKTIAFCSTVTSPLFVLLAAISPEVMDVLFGDKWNGVDKLSIPLMLLGAVHTIQYVSGAFLTSIAKSSLTFAIGLAKTFSIVIILYFFGSNNSVQLTWLFVISQLLVTPLSFYVVWSQIKFPLREFFTLIIESLLGSGLSFLIVTLMRDEIASLVTTSFFRGLILAIIFAIVHVLYILIVNPKRISLIYDFVKDKK